MNEEQEAALGILLKDLEGKDVEELYTYLTVTRIVGWLISAVGIGTLLLTMLIPSFFMFLAAGFIIPPAFKSSIALDRVKFEVKKIIRTKDTDK